MLNHVLNLIKNPIDSIYSFDLILVILYYNDKRGMFQ